MSLMRVVSISWNTILTIATRRSESTQTISTECICSSVHLLWINIVIDMHILAV